MGPRVRRIGGARVTAARFRERIRAAAHHAATELSVHEFDGAAHEAYPQHRRSSIAAILTLTAEPSCVVFRSRAALSRSL